MLCIHWQIWVCKVFIYIIAILQALTVMNQHLETAAWLAYAPHNQLWYLVVYEKLLKHHQGIEKDTLFNEIDLMPHTSFCYNCILIVRAVFRHLSVYILWNIFVEEQSHCSACSVVLPITELWFLVYHRDTDKHKYVLAGMQKFKVSSNVLYQHPELVDVNLLTHLVCFEQSCKTTGLYLPV